MGEKSPPLPSETTVPLHQYFLVCLPGEHKRRVTKDYWSAINCESQVNSLAYVEQYLCSAIRFHVSDDRVYGIVNLCPPVFFSLACRVYDILKGDSHRASWQPGRVSRGRSTRLCKTAKTSVICYSKIFFPEKR